MKKYFGLFVGVLLCVLFLSGCEKVNSGSYKEGTYFGTYTDTYGSNPSVATAVVYVDNSGVIKSVFLDTTYLKGTTVTTKKTLGTEYGMKSNSEAGKEWYEQVNLIEAKVIENQSISFITLDDEGKTDAIAGVTMKVSALYQALILL
jgi:hypothetical protein